MSRRPKKSVEAGVWAEFDRIACERHDGHHYLIGVTTGVVAGFGFPTARLVRGRPIYPSAVAAIKAAVEEAKTDAG